MKLPPSPKCAAKILLRVSFGVALALVGVNHYMTISTFAPFVAGGLGPIDGLGTLWAYILPALMIVGGALLAAGYREDIGVYASGVALASIVIGMLLKPVFGDPASLGTVMPAVNDAFLWLLVYFFVVKSCLCSGSCKEGGMAMGGHGNQQSCGCC
ncbi:MAG TPA: hypothetical protein VJB60_05020 [Candidatus Peribacterales bacterium]|nr:hypothetical protein [Candidatus Peribacterales bacterium]